MKTNRHAMKINRLMLATSIHKAIPVSLIRLCFHGVAICSSVLFLIWVGLSESRVVFTV